MPKHGLGARGVLVRGRVPNAALRIALRVACCASALHPRTALAVRGLDLAREAREAHEPAAAVPLAPKDGNAPAAGSLAASAATAEWQRLILYCTYHTLLYPAPLVVPRCTPARTPARCALAR